MALKKAAQLLVYHVNKMQLRLAMRHLRSQAKKVTHQQIRHMSAFIGRVMMGFVARRKVATIRANLQRQRNALLLQERRRRAVVVFRAMARAACFVIRMRRIWHRRRALLFWAATAIQRTFRGVAARSSARRLKATRLLNLARSVTLLCVRLLSRARRSLTLRYKIAFVNEWMENIAQMEREKTQAFREQGSALTIGRAFRSYRMRVKLRKILYWQRIHHIVNIQKQVGTCYAD
jgi:hypothetical protein